ncbi:MAG TPA: ABC transporter permease [Terriglobales bacterium]|nr:ABC transporter permease [Terriglobales bacterium]
MLSRLRHMLIKEFIQVYRDKRTRFMLFGPTIIQMLIFGYAATLDIKHLPTAILDYDNSQVSRELISHFSSSRYFTVRAPLTNRRQIRELIDRGDVLLAIQINAGFARDLVKGRTARLEVIVDASNANTALIGLGYVNQLTANFASDYQEEIMLRTFPSALSRMPSVVLEHRPWFNIGLLSLWFFVPGLIGNLVLVTVVNLTAFAVVREREIGTLEQIMVTPIRRLEFILGKTVPFFLIGFLEASFISVVGILWFDVPFRGSIAVLALGTALFLLCALGIGLFLSTISSTQQQAMVSGFFFIMPAMVLSGFATPIASMPAVLQWITYLDPLRYFLVVLRGVYLKGIGLGVLWPQMAAMMIFGVVMLTVSVLRFQKSLD